MSYRINLFLKLILLSCLILQTAPSASADPNQPADTFTFKGKVVDVNDFRQIGQPILADPNRVNVTLSLQDCISRAIAYNLDLRISGQEPAIQATDVIEAEAAFDAVLFSSAQFERTDRVYNDSGFYLGTVTTGGGTSTIKRPSDPFVNTHDDNYALGLRKRLPTGASLELSQNLRRYRDLEHKDELFYDPFYEYSLQLQLRQPLLRDFGIDVNLASIRASRNNFRISQQEFNAQVISAAEEVETNYWRLVFARQRVKIYEGLRDRARETLELIKKRRLYDLRSLALAQVRGVIQNAQANLIASVNTVLQQQDILLESLNDPELPLQKRWEIIPTDKPGTGPYQTDYAQFMQIALQKRPEIIEQRLRIETADIIEGVAKNQRLPRLDLVLQQEVTGGSDTASSAWSRQRQNDFTNYLLGMLFEVPLGNRAAEAVLNRARLRKQQENLRLLSVREQVLTDVSIAVNNLNYSFREIAERQKAVNADLDELLNYLALQESGRRDTMTPEFLYLKLNADERLASSQVAAAQTMIQYNLAIMQLYRSQGTLLRYNNIKLAELAGNNGSCRDNTPTP